MKKIGEPSSIKIAIDTNRNIGDRTNKRIKAKNLLNISMKRIKSF